MYCWDSPGYRTQSDYLIDGVGGWHAMVDTEDSMPVMRYALLMHGQKQSLIPNPYMVIARQVGTNAEWEMYELLSIIPE